MMRLLLDEGFPSPPGFDVTTVDDSVPPGRGRIFEAQRREPFAPGLRQTLEDAAG